MTGVPESEAAHGSFTSIDVELAKIAVEVLDVLRVPEELNQEFSGVDNLDAKIEEYGRYYRQLFAELFLENDEDDESEDGDLIAQARAGEETGH
jgi:hypothetical protein